jgi:dTDP-4-dehydrorhamnose reductase
LSKKILITGSKGQLGKSLFNFLSKHFTILATSKTPDKDTRKMNVCNRDQIKNILLSFAPDIIINCAAYTDVDSSEIYKNKAHDVNVKGLRNLIQLSQVETKIIQISSDYVYDGNDGFYIESDQTHPINYYGKTKLEAENVLRGSMKKWTILRPSVLYGSDFKNKANFFGWVYTNLNNDNPIQVVDDQISNPTYIEDMVKIIFQTIIMDYSGILNVGSEDSISRYMFAKEIAKIFNFNNQLVQKIKTDYLYDSVKTYKAKRPLNNSFIIKKLEQELNFTPSLTKFNLKLIKDRL